MELLGQVLEVVLHLDRHLDALIRDVGPWTYAVLFAIVFCETGLVVTPFLPGDSLLFAAGALAARGSLQVATLAVVLVVAAIAGDAANYWMGRTLGARIFTTTAARFIRREYYDRTHEFYERHGSVAIIVGRFTPIIRTFAPFVAGVANMTYGRFAAYNVVGGILWVGLFVFGGYLFGNLPVVRDHFSLVLLAVVAVSVVPIIVAVVQERRRMR